MASVPPNVDKALNPMPSGMPMAMPDEPMLEIEIENPESVKVNGEEITPPESEDFYKNLADEIDEGILQQLATDLVQSIKDDIQARADWEKMYTEGINLLGLKYENRTDPWQGACGAFHPIITEAVIRFQADTMMETFPAKGPVKTQIVGKLTKDKQDAARRVEDDLNWQIMDNMPEFRPDHEKLMWNLPSAGCGFKKVYDCPVLGRQTSVFVPAEDVIIPYGTTDLQTCERIAHRMRKTKLEANKMQESGFWRDVQLPEPNYVQNDDIQKKKDKETGTSPVLDKRHTFYEVAVDLDIPETPNEDARDMYTSGKARPYIVTVLDDARTLVAIRRNWKEGDKFFSKRLHFVKYDYIPGYGAYGFGLFHLLGGYAQSATSILRQLVDAGTLSNLPGGLKSRGLRIKGDDQPISPGEFRDVDVASGNIRDSILPLPYKEPSATLHQLLRDIVDDGRRFAATNDLKVSDMSAQAPVGTMLAVLERQLRTMSAVQARVHFAFKQELRLLADIIRDNTSPEYDYEVDAPDGAKAKQADYSYVSIIPVSDPNAATMSQRVVQYQAVIQLAQTAPQIYDQPELHRQMLTVLGIKNVGKLIPTEDDIKLVDPVQENQNLLLCKPVKALDWQDHESHIRVHMAAMQDPLIKELIGQNPRAQQILSATTAHIAEHVGYAYRGRIQQTLGMPLPALGQDDSLAPEYELQLSKAMAQAAPMVLQQSQQIVAQQQAQQNAQDPVLQAQVMEQQNAKAEIDRKSQRDRADIALEQKKLQLEAQKSGIDPQTLQLDMAIKQQQASVAMQAQQNKSALDTAKTNAALQQEHAKTLQTLHLNAVKGAMDVAAKRQELKLQSDKHAHEKRLKREKHLADIEAKRKAAEQKPKENK